MTRKSFIAMAQDIIEDAIASAQGVDGGVWGDTSPNDAAREIASLVPSIAWSDDE